MKRIRVRQMDRRGFTLIELLIVLAILVGIAALALPRLMGSRKKAEINTAKTQIGLFQSTLEKYEFDTRGLPGTEQGLAALVSMPAAADESGGEVASTGWDGPYLDSIPPDPWGMAYQYEYPPTRSSGLRPEIWSFGPDRADGTADDVCSWSGSSTGGVDEEGNPIEPDPMDAGMDSMDQPPMSPMDGPGGRGRPPAMPGGQGGMPPRQGGAGGPPPLPPAGGMSGPPPMPARQPAQPNR